MEQFTGAEDGRVDGDPIGGIGTVLDGVEAIELAEQLDEEVALRQALAAAILDDLEIEKVRDTRDRVGERRADAVESSTAPAIYHAVIAETQSMQ